MNTLDNLKDEYIKEKLKQDKTISNKANHVFENFKITNKEDVLNQTEENNQTKKYKTINRYLAYAASFLFVIMVGVGTLAYKQSNNNIGTQTTVNPAIIKNSEVLVSNEQIAKETENDYFAVKLTKENAVIIQLKQKAIDKYNANTTTDKQYEVSGVISIISDVFVGSIGSEESQYVMLLLKDGTIEYVDVLSNYSQYNEFNFKNDGLIYGYYDIVGFEQNKESQNGTTKYCVYAINKDGVKEEIIIRDDNEQKVKEDNEQKVVENLPTFTSQDGEKTFIINSKPGDYIQMSGWAGASNNVYYIDNECLYHLSLVDGAKTKLITGVDSIKFDVNSEKVEVTLKTNYVINKGDPYLNIKKDVISIKDYYNETEYTIKNEYGNADAVSTIKGRDFTVLPGGSARSYVYYISGSDLYEVQLVDNFPKRKIAEGIQSLTNSENEKIIATKGENTKVLVQINYIEYK